MKKGYLGTVLAVAGFVTATATHAAVHRVYPGESIQDAIDMAAAGDTILVEPGVYKAPADSTYGLHITKDNIRLIGKVKKGRGEEGKVRLVYDGEFYKEENMCLAPDKDDRDPVCKTGQRTGVWASR